MPSDYLSLLIVGITNDEELHLLFQGPGLLGSMVPILFGIPQHLSAPRVVSHHPHDPIRARFPYSPEGVGDPEKLCSDVTFLLVLPEEGVVGESVWACHHVGVSLPG